MRARRPDIVCFSHLRWDFVFQRPNHLMTRAAQSRRVFFIEEPQRVGRSAHIASEERNDVLVARPVLPEQIDEAEVLPTLRLALDGFLEAHGVEQPWRWYYTPMALPWSEHVPASAVIYDCMDELSSFRFAPGEIRDLERRLLARADVLFTGGQSLYEAKRRSHRHAYPFPSSVDSAHFGQARQQLEQPADQAAIGSPRLGYFGVIDERIDLALVEQLARARSDWNVVMVGPLAKLDERDLPQAPNLHWLGQKAYAELPAYLAGWDVAIMPFALNEATRHISPTKTPEYLSGGKPVVSTPIRDVVSPYGEAGLVSIAADAAEFISAAERLLSSDRADLIARADRMLASQSWDATWQAMEELVVRHSRPDQRAPSAGYAAASAGERGVAGTGVLRPPALRR